MTLRKIFSLVAIALALMFAIPGFVIIFADRSGFAETEATVQRIERVSSGTNSKGKTEYYHKTYVYYNVDGKNYEMQELGSYHNDYYVGKKIKIYYNVNNPFDIHGDDIVMGIILLCVSAALFVAAGVFIFKGDFLDDKPTDKERYKSDRPKENKYSEP